MIVQLGGQRPNGEQRQLHRRNHNILSGKR
jgi:hypothetical protein